jgi:hypothetical protein
MGGDALQRRAPPRGAAARGGSHRGRIQLCGFQRITHPHAAHPIIGRVGLLRLFENLQQLETFEFGVVALIRWWDVVVVVPVAQVATEIDVALGISAAVVKAQP